MLVKIPDVKFIHVPGGMERLVVLSERDYNQLLRNLDLLVRDTPVSTGQDTAPDSDIPPSLLARIEKGESALKVLRNWRGMSARELADMVHVTPSWLSQMENTGRVGSVKTLCKIAKVLDVSLALLMEHQNPMRRAMDMDTAA